MNKLLSICYALLGCVCVICSSYINRCINPENLWYMNLLMFLPMLTLSIVSVWLYFAKMKATLISDIVVMGVCYQITSMVLIVYPMLQREVFTLNVCASNIFLYGATYPSLFLLCIKGKLKNQKIQKALTIVCWIFLAIGIIFSLLNCFVRVLEPKFF